MRIVAGRLVCHRPHGTNLVDPATRADHEEMHVDSDGDRNARIRSQYNSLLTEARSKIESSSRTKRIWRYAHYALGVPAASLAAVSGLTALSSTAGRIPAAILSLTASVIVAVSIFLRCDEKASVAGQKKDAWRVLEADVRFALANNDDVDDLSREMRSLLDRRERIFAHDFAGSMTQPPTARRA